jgi:hypothetical protein
MHALDSPQFDAERERHVSNGEAVKNRGADTYLPWIELIGYSIEKSSASRESRGGERLNYGSCPRESFTNWNWSRC